jgi:hypothetical protein
VRPGLPNLDARSLTMTFAESLPDNDHNGVRMVVDRKFADVVISKSIELTRESCVPGSF